MATFTIHVPFEQHYAYEIEADSVEDEDDEQLIWRLFEEFGHKQTDNAFYEIAAIAAIAENKDGGPAHEPKCGWHDNNVYSVSYDDIEIMIDRQKDGEVEIRAWRNGKYEEYPYAKVTFEVDTFVCGHCVRTDVESAECESCEFSINCCTHQHNDDDLESKVNLDQVYKSLEAAIDVVCDVDMRNAISAEYRKLIRLRYVFDEKAKYPLDPVFDQQAVDEELLDAQESLRFSTDEILQLTAFAKGIIDGMMTFRYGDSAASVDHWFQCGTIGDVHLCDDEEEETILAWACRLKFDDNGQVTGTDTSRSVRLDLGDTSLVGAMQR